MVRTFLWGRETPPQKCLCDYGYKTLWLEIL